MKWAQFCCLWNTFIYFFNVLGENLFETSKVHELSGSRVSSILLKLFSRLLLFCKCNSTMSLNSKVWVGVFFVVLEVRCLATRSSVFVKMDLCMQPKLMVLSSSLVCCYIRSLLSNRQLLLVCP